jgi:CBS domain-containing protein
MGLLSTAIGFGAGYVLGTNRDTVRNVTAKAREVASRTTARARTGDPITDIRQVSEVMTAMPETVRPDTTVADAAKLMRDGNFGGVLVAETEGEAVVGIVTDRDIAVRAVAADRSPDATTLRSIMSRDIASVSPSDTIEEAKAKMRAANVRRLPVLENGRPVGIVSLGDLSLATDTGTTLADISVASPDR